MKTIKNNTKQAERYINAYNRSDIYSLNEAYGKPSTAKIRADHNCRIMMENESGHGYRIIEHCRNFFTVAWIAGNALRVETATNSFIIPEAAE